jgi:hypothetical protein
MFTGNKNVQFSGPIAKLLGLDNSEAINFMNQQKQQNDIATMSLNDASQNLYQTMQQASFKDGTVDTSEGLLTGMVTKAGVNTPIKAVTGNGKNVVIHGGSKDKPAGEIVIDANSSDAVMKLKDAKDYGNLGRLVADTIDSYIARDGGGSNSAKDGTSKLGISESKLAEMKLQSSALRKMGRTKEADDLDNQIKNAKTIPALGKQVNLKPNLTDIEAKKADVKKRLADLNSARPGITSSDKQRSDWEAKAEALKKEWSDLNTATNTLPTVEINGNKLDNIVKEAIKPKVVNASPSTPKVNPIDKMAQQVAGTFDQSKINTDTNDDLTIPVANIDTKTTNLTPEVKTSQVVSKTETTQPVKNNSVIDLIEETGKKNNRIVGAQGLMAAGAFAKNMSNTFTPPPTMQEHLFTPTFFDFETVKAAGERDITRSQEATMRNAEENNMVSTMAPAIDANSLMAHLELIKNISQAKQEQTNQNTKGLTDTMNQNRDIVFQNKANAFQAASNFNAAKNAAAGQALNNAQTLLAEKANNDSKTTDAKVKFKSETQMEDLIKSFTDQLSKGKLMKDSEIAAKTTLTL